MKKIMDELKFNNRGLIPAIIQDDPTGRVLTLCYMNKDALEKTAREGMVYVFRRSKNSLMLKGGTSGHTQAVKAIFVDCEYNSILIRVEQKVAACHAGYFSCYYRKIEADGSQKISEEKIFNPDDVYKRG